jgi:hypothetical protein
VGCVLDWLRQIGEGAVHNVPHTIYQRLKIRVHVKIRRSQIILYILISNCTTFFDPFSAIIKYCSLRNITIVHWTCQHKIDTQFFRVLFTLKSRFPPTHAVSKPKLCEMVYYNIYCYNNYQCCCLQLLIVMFTYTYILHHYITPHCKYDTVHVNVFSWSTSHTRKN